MRAAGKMRRIKKSGEPKKAVGKTAIARSRLGGKSSSAIVMRASDGQAWQMPSESFGEVIRLLHRLQKSGKVIEFPSRKEELVSPNEAFSDLYEATSKQAVMLRASRNKKGWTQKELAEKLEITQADVSNMEKGRRAISKAMAAKLGGIFGTDYRVFL